MAKVGIGITTFNAPVRLAKLLEVLKLEGWPDVPVRVFEDPWKNSVVTPYRGICAEYGVPYERLPVWSCMQGSAEYAAAHTPEDWFFYLPDDVLPTPGCVENVLRLADLFDSTSVGGFQVPYWNADDLPSQPWPDHPQLPREGLENGLNGYAKDFMWTAHPEWLAAVPKNPKWEENGVIPYMNLNGAGFCLRREAWHDVGGFSQKTWCLDEDISAKLWTRTNWTIVAVPGEPLVHYMGAALEHPPHHFHCAECWKAAGWPDKPTLHNELRRIIREKTGWGREMEYDGEAPAKGGWWK